MGAKKESGKIVVVKGYAGKLRPNQENAGKCVACRRAVFVEPEPLKVHSNRVRLFHYSCAMCLVWMLGGCAAPLTRPETPASYNCAALDNTHRTFGAIAKFSGVVAGSGGLATLPLSGDDQKTARVVVGISAVAIGGLAAAAVFVEEDAAATWSQECQNKVQAPKP